MDTLKLILKTAAITSLVFLVFISSMFVYTEYKKSRKNNSDTLSINREIIEQEEKIPKNSFTREKAKEILQEHWRKKTITYRIHIGLSSVNMRILPINRYLAAENYITFSLERGYRRANITMKGINEFSILNPNLETDQHKNSYSFDIPMGYYEVVSITGITDSDIISNAKSVEYTIRAIRPTVFYDNLDQETFTFSSYTYFPHSKFDSEIPSKEVVKNARFILYDDGWRLKDAD